MAASLAECQSCFVAASNTEEKQLYVCGQDGCRVQWEVRCLRCGQQSHTNHAVFNHEFGARFMEVQERSKLAMQKYNSSTSNLNHAVKGTATLGAMSMVGVYQVGMLQAVKEFGMKQGVKKFMGASWDLSKHGKGAVAGIQVALCVWEVGCELKRYNDGIISKKECIRLAVRAVTAHSLAFGGALGGAAVGGACAGLPGAAIGAVVGGIVGDLSSRFVFDRFIWSDEDDDKQAEEVNQALQTFGFVGCTFKNVMKEPLFTRENLQTKYHNLAIDYHPDRPTGNNDRFADIVNKYNVLLGVLTEKEK